MVSCIHISLMLATLLTQTSSGDQEECHKAIQDLVKVVPSCPTSKQEWDIAASKKNCEQLAAKALCNTSEKPYFYHCVINGFRNQTLEVCAPRKIIFGHCTEFNVAGGVIQRHATAECNSTFPKCDKSYNSTEAYKYPDCYKLVSKNRDVKTTTILPDERTTTSKPEHGNNPIIYVMIVPVVVICVAVAILIIKMHKRRTSNDEEECTSLIEKKKDPSIKYFYIKAKHFHHFHYVNNLAKDCELRLEKVKRDENRRKCMSDKVVMIKVIGNLTGDNLNLLSKVKEEKNMRREMLEISWKAAPLLCFQNDLQSESALEILSKENARHKILIHSDVHFDKTCKADGPIITVGQDKQQIQEIITSCLVEQLDQVLGDWLEKLKHKDLNKQTHDIIAEIEAIRKQLILDTRHNTNDLDAPCIANKSIVPNDVKEYLFRQVCVNGFGIWGRSTIQIFVKKITDHDKKMLKKELINLNPNFFEKYHLEVETRNMVEKQTMRHYVSTSLKYNMEDTFQKLSRKPYDETKKQDNNLAFTDYCRESRSIGLRLYRARDFNAYENKDFDLKIWMGTGKKYRTQKINVLVSIRRLVNDDIGHKYHNNKESIFSSGSHVFVFIHEFASMFFFPDCALLKFFNIYILSTDEKKVA